ncbi:MAG: WD40 repeat domain-containing protein [Candidatus Omnitrophica bacterium]|nr:WD40 repeat domain-containing protein [Candidatus Omnitrophota bacterium]
MKKLIGFGFMVLIALSYCVYGQTWYIKNENLRAIYPSNVWTCIEKARQFHNAGNHQMEDMYLRKAEQMTLAAEPFSPTNWPSHWPRTQEALDILRYASPSAYIYRIFGDYAEEHSRPKEAIKYIRMYLDRSYIPDASYLFKLGNLLESETLYQQAIAVYQELINCIKTKNFHNSPPSVSMVQSRIRVLNAKLEPQILLVLDMKLQDLPDFLSNAGQVFKEKLLLLDEKNYIVVKDQTLDRILSEQRLTRRDIIDDLEERDRIIKLLNVRYTLEPYLVKIENQYIFQVRVYRAGQREPIENFEYKNENYEFLPNYFQRFVFEFQGKQISKELLIPENSYQWTYETSEEITSLAVSESGNRIIAGCKDGKVYLLNRNGSLRKIFKQQDEIIQVAISPDGNYSAWASIDGRLCFAEGTKVIFQTKVKNVIRAISIGEKGKFWVYAIDDKIYYLDSNGEIFWTRRLPDWVQSLKMSHDCSFVVAGTTAGDIFVYNNEGNLAWNKRLGASVDRIRISPKIEHISAGLRNNLAYIFSSIGNEVIRFTLGGEVRLLTFNQDIIEAIIGTWNQWYYFVDEEKKNVWYYSMDKSVKMADSATLNNFYVLAKGKSLLAYKVVWK